MRLKLIFKLENNIIDIQYRKSIISWIKNSIQKYDSNLFEETYNHGNKMKSFTFAPILPKPIFNKEEIILKDPQFSIVLSEYNYVYGLHLYNSFMKQVNQKYPLNKNSMTLESIVIIPEKNIKNNSILIKMSSPLIVRNHDRETLKDMYYAYNRPEFSQYLKINIKRALIAENLDENLLDDFEIKEISPKKIIVSLYEKKIECSIGSFELNGKTELLDYLYKAGIGSKRSMGFGLFEIIK